MALTAKQQQLLKEIDAGRVWSTGSWDYPRWFTVSAEDAEGEEPIDMRTARSLVHRGLVRFTPHATSRHVKWVELTDDGKQQVTT